MLDYDELEEIVSTWAELTTCPTTNDPLNPHWDWDDATGDCTLWPRDRSPRPLLTRLVRHAFHDSVGEMDGHLNLQDPEHNGLEASTIILDDIHAGTFPSSGEPIANALNKADLVAWAGIACVRLTSRRQNRKLNRTGGEDNADNVPAIPLRYGRKSYDSNVDREPDEVFPTNGAGGKAMDVEAYFLEHYGFTARETVTLLGAHTLGSARPEESGYSGPWTQSKNRFNSAYYSNMMAPETPDQCEEDPADATAGRCFGWEQTPVRNRDTGDFKFQWRHSCNNDADSRRRGCRQLMLNIDMALFRDIDEFICDDAKVANGECAQPDHGKVSYKSECKTGEHICVIF
jgi:hypothetical protein